MPSLSRPRVLRGFLVVSGLSVSALALAALVSVQNAGEPASALAPEPAMVVGAVGVGLVAQPAAKPVESALPVRKPDQVQPVEPAAPEAVQVLLEVPDFKGKRLSQVMRKVKELGLKVVARDEYGERVSARDAAYYRVRKQLTAPGTKLAPKGQIDVRVREVVDYAAGY